MAKAKGTTKRTAQPVQCYCGCGETVTRRFKPGHDARVHSVARQIVNGELGIRAALKPLHPDARKHLRSVLEKEQEKAEKTKKTKKMAEKEEKEEKKAKKIKKEEKKTEEKTVEVSAHG